MIRKDLLHLIWHEKNFVGEKSIKLLSTEQFGLDLNCVQEPSGKLAAWHIEIFGGLGKLSLGSVSSCWEWEAPLVSDGLSLDNQEWVLVVTFQKWISYTEIYIPKF